MKPAMTKVDVHGTDKPISFICRIKEELCECPCIQCVFVCVTYTCGLVDACILCTCVLFTAHTTIQLLDIVEAHSCVDNTMI